ncbi:MAG: insulinase family protein [Paludibacteraceae bacterium]|nr:insulinase family protein [Paludibacteraceae bacterium]
MKKLLFSVALLATTLFAGAQQFAPLPVDSAVRIGHLDNGLTYYIRHNEMPKQRCEFHIAQAVGAILEEDHQNGLAHFLEHMAFNGTEHFPGKGIIEYFESIGVNFGGNINAYTSLDQTVYRLSDVPTYREGIIDSALLVMHDWACGLSLLGEEIDAERGVIREEWRTGANASRRMWKEGNRQMYPGSQYAKRDVIGDTAVINNFAYQALRDYYHKWYGPDNQAIIVVGDIDVDAIEAKIKNLWKDVPARQNRGERPIYGIPDNEEPIYALVKDREAQSSTIRIMYKHDVLPEQVKGTTAAYLLDLLDNIIYYAVSERFQDLALDSNSPMRGGAAMYSNIVKSKNAFIGVVAPKEGQEKAAYQLLLLQLEKLRRYGITTAEMERAKNEILSSYENSYNERASRRNRGLAEQCINHFLDASPLTAIEWDYSQIGDAMNMIGADLINQRVQSYFTDNNIILCFLTPDKDNIDVPAREEAIAMLKDVRNAEIEAPAEENVNRPLVKKAPKKGKIKKVKRNDQLGSTEWILSNGIHVIIRPTEFKQDEINMSAYSQGGTSLIANVDDLPSADLATTIVDYMGYGEFKSTELAKALSGKQCGANFAINTYSENVSGSSTVKDFETMLQLTYLGFTAPRRDEDAFNTLMNLLRQSIANREMNHKGIWRDSINLMASNYSPRALITDAAYLDKVNLDKALSIYKTRFANPADFTFVFVGNINPNDPNMQELICKWLGGLKTKKNKHESFKDLNIRVAQGKQKNYFTRDMQIHTASNRIQYTSYDIPYTIDNDVNMEMIGRILSTRYLESIREREGGSYGVGCGGYMNRLPVPAAILVMQFDTDPLKQERLMEIIHEEVMTIINDGPLASDLQKEKESMLKDLEEDLETNSWWMSTITRYYRYNENMLQDYKKAVENISAQSVQALLKKLVAAGNVFEVVMFPETSAE